MVITYRAGALEERSAELVQTEISDEFADGY